MFLEQKYSLIIGYICLKNNLLKLRIQKIILNANFLKSRQETENHKDINQVYLILLYNHILWKNKNMQINYV